MRKVNEIQSGIAELTENHNELEQLEESVKALLQVCEEQCGGTALPGPAEAVAAIAEPAQDLAPTGNPWEDMTEAEDPAYTVKVKSSFGGKREDEAAWADGWSDWNTRRSHGQEAWTEAEAGWSQPQAAAWTGGHGGRGRDAAPWAGAGAAAASAGDSWAEDRGQADWGRAASTAPAGNPWEDMTEIEGPQVAAWAAPGGGRGRAQPSWGDSSSSGAGWHDGANAWRGQQPRQQPPQGRQADAYRGRGAGGWQEEGQDRWQSQDNWRQADAGTAWQEEWQQDAWGASGGSKWQGADTANGSFSASAKGSGNRGLNPWQPSKDHRQDDPWSQGADPWANGKPTRSPAPARPAVTEAASWTAQPDDEKNPWEELR